MRKYSGFYILAIMLGMLFILETSLNAETIWQKRQKALQAEPQVEKQVPAETPAPIEDQTDLSDMEDLYAPQEDALPDDTLEEPAAVTAFETSDPYTIKIPEQYGTIIESSKGANDKLIIYIQDAHANYEAQMNIANVIESLIKNYGVKLILKEGGVSDRDYTYLRSRASPAERKERADKLLREAVLRGEEYLNIVSDYPMSFQGIEDKELYDKQVNALWELDKFKDIAGEYVSKLINAADQIKPKIYNPDLIEFDQKRKDYDAETIDLVAYYAYLYKKAQEKGAGVSQFENFATLVKANDIEKKVNMADIVSGKATDEEKAQYKEYTDLLKNLNVQKLFKEEPILENALKESLAENNDQKELLNISKALGIMKNLLIIKIVPEEYDYFNENKKYFNPGLWTNFLQAKADANGISIDMPQNQYVISDNLDKVGHFYSLAFERNQAFIENIDKRVNKDNAKIAALVAGGFHTPKLTQLLAEKGYSYVVISPKVTTPTDDVLYRASLKTDWAAGIQ